MFNFNNLSLKENIEQLKKISEKKIAENKALKNETFNEFIDKTIREIFEKNELEHIGNNIYSNKTHGQIEEEALLIKIEKEIISKKEEVKLNIKISIEIGALKEEEQIGIEYSENKYYISEEKDHEKILKEIKQTTMGIILEEELTKKFRILCP